MGPRTSSTPSHPAPSAWRNHVSSGVLLDDDLLADLKSVDQHEHITLAAASKTTISWWGLGTLNTCCDCFADKACSNDIQGGFYS